MPKRSEREDILSELEGVIKYLASDTSLLVEREENDFPGNLQDDLLLYYSTIKESRYLIPRTYKVGKPSLAIFLRDYTDRQFRQEVRMDRGIFEKLCDNVEYISDCLLCQQVVSSPFSAFLLIPLFPL